MSATASTAADSDEPEPFTFFNKKDDVENVVQAKLSNAEMKQQRENFRSYAGRVQNGEADQYNALMNGAGTLHSEGASEIDLWTAKPSSKRPRYSMRACGAVKTSDHARTSGMQTRSTRITHRLHRQRRPQGRSPTKL